MSNDQEWFVYMVRCADNSLYSGITTDIKRRIIEHNTLKSGAKYTKSRRPVTLVYSETSDNKSTASKRESILKRLSKQAKEALIHDSL